MVEPAEDCANDDAFGHRSDQDGKVCHWIAAAGQHSQSAEAEDGADDGVGAANENAVNQCGDEADPKSGVTGGGGSSNRCCGHVFLLARGRVGAAYPQKSTK